MARSSASTRAAQLSLSCSSGATVRDPGSSAASSVCQCSATWSRSPGTNRIVERIALLSLVMVEGSAAASGVQQEALLAGLTVRREAVFRQGLLGALVELADAVDALGFLAGGDLAAELTRDADQLLDLL